jgi:hypothetical protein
MPENPYQNTNLENLINQVRENASPSNLLNTPDANPTIDISKLSQSSAQDYLNSSLQNVFKMKEDPLLPTPIKATDIDTSGRFDKQSLGWDNEDIYGQIQSNWDKAANGFLKGVGLAGTTFLQGTLGLIYGVGSAIGTGEFNKLYNNELSNKFDEFNKSMENTLPNYYTARERNAEWWEPANLLTTNFVFDKFIKNLGFSLGALYSGGAVAKALKLVPELFSLSLAKNAIQSAELIEQAASTANPISRLNTVTNAIRNASNGINAANSFTAPLERFVVSTLGAATEGGIEALQGINEHRNALIEEYKNKYGYSPTGDDLAKIDNNSENLGNARFGLNMLLLTGTNYVMLPKILGSSYSTSKALANGVETTFSPIEKNAAGLFESALPKAGVGKLLHKAKNISSLFFSPTEAFEETTQYAIDKGVNNYYNKAYRGEGRDFIESISEGYKAALSDKEGLESLLIGGLSGGIQQAGFISSKGFFKSGNIAERGFTGYGGERAENTNSLINSLNNTKLKFKSDAWLKDLAESAARGVNLQLEGEKYIRQGDVLESKDNEFDYLHNYLSPRIKYGRHDLVKDDIEMYRQMAATNFEFLQQNGIANENDTPATFLNRLSNFEKHADNTQSLYKSLNLRYSGIVDKQTGERIYPDEVIDKMVYAASKVSDYDGRITELNNNLSIKGINVFNVTDSILRDATEALEQINNLTTISEEKDYLKEQLQDVIEISLRRKEFLKEYDRIKKNPKQAAPTPVDDRETTAEIKQRENGKIVKREVELNKEYPLKSEPIFRDGNKIAINPSITVKSKTLGGEYEVTLPDGTTSYLTPSELKDYEISQTTPITSPEMNKVVETTIYNVLVQEGYSSVAKPDTPLNELVEFVNTLNSNTIVNKIQAAVRKNTKDLREQLEAEEKRRAEFEANKKLQEQLFASQQAAEQTAGDVATPAPTNTRDSDEDYAKTPLYNFLSKESMYEPGEMKLHQKLRNSFLLNYDSFTEQQKGRIRVITVTKDNEEALGLQGFTEYALQGYTPEEGEIPIIKLYVTTDGGSYSLIREDGSQSRTPLGKSQDFQKEEIENKRKEELAKYRPPTTSSAENSFKIRDITNIKNPKYYYIPENIGRKIYEGYAKYLNAQSSESGIQSYEKVSQRAVITISKDNNEPNEYYPNWFNELPGVIEINAKYDAELTTQFTEARDFNEAVFGLFHEPNFGTYKYGQRTGKIAYSKGTEEEHKQAIAAHRRWRDSVIETAKRGEFRVYEIQGISRGRAEITTDTEGNPTEPNPVIGTLAKKSDLNKLLIQVPTKENDIQLKTDGRSLNLPIGRPVFVNGNTIEPLNNRKFTPDEIDNLYTLIKKLSENRKGEFADNIISYLKGMLYWKTPTGTPGRNQIWIDIEGNLRLGNTAQSNIQFTPESIEANKSKLIAFLSEAYNNINNLKVRDLQKPFIELSVNSDGTLKETEHPNYQSFLLTGERPLLTTNIRKINTSIPNDTNYRYKYSTLVGNEFEIPKQVKPQEPAKQQPTEEARIASNTEIEIKGKKFSIGYSVSNGEIEISSGTKEVLDYIKKEKNSKGQFIFDALKQNAPDYSDEEVSESLIRTLLKPKITPVQTEDEDIIKQEIERLRKEAKKQETPTSDWKDSQFRIARIVEQYSPIDVEKELAYIKEKLPFSVSLVNEILRTPDGMYAWGKYKDLTITLFEKAQEGTGYHEAFEGVWDVFTSQAEKKRLTTEFNSRQESFLNRVTGLTQTYQSATQQEAKEQIADEFANYILNNEKPPKARTSLIERWFRNIWNFIKSVLTGEVQTIDQIFSRIDAGKYKSATFKNIPSLTTEYSRDYRIGELDFTKTYQVTRGMVAEVIQKFLQDNNSLTEFDEKSSQSVEKLYQYVYTRLEDFYTKAIFDSKVFPQIANNPTLLESYYKIWKNISGNWDQVKSLTNEYLKLFNIVVDENTEEDDVEAAASENADRNEYVKDSFKVDGKKNAAKSIKLLISTISEAAFDQSNQSASLSSSANDKSVVSDRAPQTGMQQLINFTKTFNHLIASLHTYNTLDEKLNKLDELRKTHPNYQRLWKRLNSSTDNLLYDWKLKVKFHNVFSKQKPEAVIMYIQPDGSSYSGKANIQGTATVMVQGWIDSLKQRALNKETDLVKYDDQGNFFLDGTKLKSQIGTLDEKIAFLAKLDIPFSKEEFSSLSSSQREAFSQAVVGLHKDLTGSNALQLESAKTLNAVNNFTTIAESKILVGDDYDSVFQNLEGEFVQTFILPNAVSKDVNNINNSLTSADLLKVIPQLNSTFAKDSVYKNEILYKDDKRTDVEIGIKYIQGTVGKSRTTANNALSQPFRLIQEINQNLNGTYYTLIPADSSTEWMLQLTNPISFSSLRDNTGPTWNRIYSIFNKYLETETSLFKADGKHRLLSELSNKYTATEEEFKANLSNYITDLSNTTFDSLSFYNILYLKESGNYVFRGIDKGFTTSNGLNFENLTENQARNIIKFRTINAIINNIEMQKLFFGDVAEFIKPTDEYNNRFREHFKRIKSFLSPRESSVYGSERFNQFLNESNKAGNITLEPTDPGYHINSDVIPTVTLSDIISTNEELAKTIPAFGKNNVTDAQAWSPVPAYKELIIKSGFRWTDKHEDVYQYRMATDRLLMEEDGVYKYTNEKLKQHDKKITENYIFPDVYFPVLKPIVSGHSETNGNFHPILDKDSVVPISYSSVRGTNMVPHYLKMLKQGIGYVIVQSGRKVGNKGTDSFYNEDGSVNESPYTNLVNVRFEDFGIQQETSGKKNDQTRGSQLTKLAVLNLFDGGQPTSPEADTLVKENIALLVEQTNNGYTRLLKNLGIRDAGSSFVIDDKSKVLNLLKSELLRREVTTNIKESLNLTEDGEFLTSFEALPNYRQIKNILFSYVEKYISRPKVSGGPKVQVSSALMEKLGIKRTIVNGKPTLTSDNLKFYAEDNAKIEVLLPFYATKLLKKAGIKFKNEQELLEIINNSPDAKEILSGIGFRIPTQELNSVDSFIIKGFLPEEMGDTIVVPEELTTKAGSDFDVDKLQTYLKNLYINNRKEVRVVPYFGIGEQAKKQLKEWLNKDVAEDLLLDIRISDSDDPFQDIDFEEEEQKAADRFERMYEQSIENGYFKNLENILALPQNFKRLVQPNSSDELISYRDRLVKIAPQEFDTKQIKSIINPLYISQLRHNYLIGKGGVGIAAVQQTGNAVSQLSDIYIDDAIISLLADRNERRYIGNGNIALPHNRNNDGKATISKMLDVSGRYISDKISQYINGFVDVSKDPFVVQIGANKNLASTFLTLERLGVPSDVVVYFMNQPIIREYIKLLDKKQTTFIYNDKNIKEIASRFNRGKKPKPTSFQEKGLSEKLISNIENYYNGKFTEQDNAEQLFIFGEFLKYYTIAQNLFRFTQGTNYDTGRFTSDYSVVFKELQYQDTEGNNIFSSTDKFMNSSFIGNIREKLLQSTQAINTISPLNNVKPTLARIASDFKRNYQAKNIVGNLIEESYIGHLIQTKLKLNAQIKDLILDTEKSVVNKFRAVKKDLTGDIANNIILTQLIPYIGKRKGTKNIKPVVKPKDVFTKELYTEAFQELLDHPSTAELARSIGRLAFLQSGVGNNILSMKEFLPNQVYTKTVNAAIAQSSVESANEFRDVDGFYRNMWSNTNIVPVLEDEDEDGFGFKYGYSYEGLKNAAFALPSLMNAAKNKFLTITRDDFNGPDVITYKYLARRVETITGEPITVTTYNEFGHPQDKVVYIAVNAWGDGIRAQEFYSEARKSEFNNGYIKIENEMSNDEVLSVLRPDAKAPSPTDNEKGGNDDVQDKINNCLGK